MPTYLYCVLAPASAERLPSGLAGIASAPIRVVKVPGLAALEAWVATIDEEALRVKGRTLAAQALLHNAVVDAALATGRTPVPARYGSRFPDDDSCITDLAGRAAELEATLEHVADAVEMPTLLVPSKLRTKSVDKPSSNDAAAGRRYLESIRVRVADEQRRRSAAEREASRLRVSVDDLVRDEARSFTAAGVMSIAHLVSREAVARYREAIETFEPAEDFRVVKGEPRAPYSFASPQDAVRGGHDSGSPSRSG
jgi:hypothetical protein